MKMPKKNMLPDVRLDENLKKVLGNRETIPTTEMLKALWKYINANNLKIPKKKVE